MVYAFQTTCTRVAMLKQIKSQTRPDAASVSGHDKEPIHGGHILQFQVYAKQICAKARVEL